MKKISLIIFVFSVIATCYGKTEIDTITTWKIYKDSKILVESYENNTKVYSIRIKKSDNFKELKINILKDTKPDSVRRKLMFKQNGKVILTYIRQLNKNTNSLIISKQDLIRLIGPDTNKTFSLEYTDDTSSTGTILCNFTLIE